MPALPLRRGPEETNHPSQESSLHAPAPQAPNLEQTPQEGGDTTSESTTVEHDSNKGDSNVDRVEEVKGDTISSPRGLELELADRETIAKFHALLEKHEANLHGESIQESDTSDSIFIAQQVLSISLPFHVHRLLLTFLLG